MLNTDLLIHELQLGEQLNHSVHGARRADFALMLAMLVDDAREHSQFHLPTTTSLESLEQQAKQDKYRVLFNLPKAPALALEKLEQINQFNQAEAITENRLGDIRLAQALQPQPLAFRDDKQHIDHDVKANTSLYCQHKQGNKKPEQVLTQDLSFNAKKWLEQMQSLVAHGVEPNKVAEPLAS